MVHLILNPKATHFTPYFYLFQEVINFKTSYDLSKINNTVINKSIYLYFQIFWWTNFTYNWKTQRIQNNFQKLLITEGINYLKFIRCRSYLVAIICLNNFTVIKSSSPRGHRYKSYYVTFHGRASPYHTYQPALSATRIFTTNSDIVNIKWLEHQSRFYIVWK